MAVTYFLLLSCLGLAITAQAQDCSRPVPGPNMDLSDKDILLQTFPDGTKVSFACSVGYTSAGGPSVITCTAGRWSPVRLTCEKKNCGSLGEMDNGIIDYPEGTEFGAKAVITCKSGWRFVGKQGPRKIVCGDQGWDGRLPECEVVVCDPPPAVVNGTFSPEKDVYGYGEVIQYRCQNDFTLNGSRSSSCSDNGTFMPESPKCIMVQCQDPDIKNADWVQGSRPPHGYKATVTYQCRTGYKMIGERTQTCEINNQWSPGLPRCEKMTGPTKPAAATTTATTTTTMTPTGGNTSNYVKPVVIVVVLIAIIIAIILGCYYSGVWARIREKLGSGKKAKPQNGATNPEEEVALS